MVSATRVKAVLARKLAKIEAETKFQVVAGFGLRPQGGAPYAIYVHEMLGNRHAAPTKARYLSDPFRSVIREMPDIIQREMRRGRTFGNALLAVGREIRDASLTEVPVDTGALRDSAFVAKERVN